MHRLMTHLRGLMVALATLALTAGVAFAARPVSVPAPDLAASGPATTEVTEDGEATVPELDDDEEEATDEAADEEEATDEASDADEPKATEDADEEEATDEDDDADAADTDHPVNHGWYVSQAAQAPTPDGYRNHGAYVSEVAKSDEGKPGSEAESEAEADAATDGDGAEVTSAKLTGKDRAALVKAGKVERKAGRAGK